VSEPYRYRTQTEIGDLIARLRREQDVSVEQFCAAVDISPETLARIEAGERSVTVREILAFSALLGIEGNGLLSTEPSLAEQWGVGPDSPQAVKDAARVMSELIEDYFGLRALVGDPASYRAAVAAR
jgi:transcriptional regulator with XRE-family HTH domain